MKKSRFPLWARVLVGLFLGAVTGFIVGDWSDFLKPIGDLFINAIQMLVVPLVLSTLVCGVAGMSDPKKMGRVGLKTIIGLVVLTAIATSLGLGMANLLVRNSPSKNLAGEVSKGGDGSEERLELKAPIGINITKISNETLDKLRTEHPVLAERLSQALDITVEGRVSLPENMLRDMVKIAGGKNVVEEESSTLSQTLKNIIPKNPLQAMAKGNILQIIVFGLFLGISISLIGEKGKQIYGFFDGLAEAMFKMVGGVMFFAPLGVFCLMAWVTGNFGVATLKELAMVVVALYLACAIHGILVCGILVTLLGLNPIRYFKGIVDVVTFAFATSSSAGTLPVTIRCSEENLGVSNSISGFVLPLCATVNMSGTAIYEGVCCVFIANMYGVELTIASYVTIVATSIIAAIGTAGVPGAGLIMLSLVLSSVGVPLEGIALIAGIDRILDMARTALNVMGDTLVATFVAKTEGELDLDVYNRRGNITE